MGRRSVDAEADWTRLAADQIVQSSETVTDGFGDEVDGSRVRLQPLVANAHHGFEASGRFADRAFRT